MQKKFVNRLHLVLHACVEIFDVTFFCLRGLQVKIKQGLSQNLVSTHSVRIQITCVHFIGCWIQIFELVLLLPPNNRGSRQNSSFLLPAASRCPLAAAAGRLLQLEERLQHPQPQLQRAAEQTLYLCWMILNTFRYL